MPLSSQTCPAANTLNNIILFLRILLKPTNKKTTILFTKHSSDHETITTNRQSFYVACGLIGVSCQNRFTCFSAAHKCNGYFTDHFLDCCDNATVRRKSHRLCTHKVRDLKYLILYTVYVYNCNDNFTKFCNRLANCS